jgi:hypothetical protein
MYATDFLHIPLVTDEFSTEDNVLDFEGHESYAKWCIERKFKQLPYRHYDIEAHKALAELILKEL